MSIEHTHEHEPFASNPEEAERPEETDQEREQREAMENAELERRELSGEVDTMQSENSAEEWQESANESPASPENNPPTTDKPATFWDKLAQFSEKIQPIIEAISQKISELRVNIARNTASLFNTIRKIPMFASSLDGLLTFVGANTSILYQELSNHPHLTFEESSPSDVEMLVMQLESDFNNQAAKNTGDDFRSFVGRTLDRFGSSKQTISVESLHEAAVAEAAADRKQTEAEPAEADNDADDSAETPANADNNETDPTSES